MSFNLKNIKKKNIIFIAVCFILLSFLFIKNIDNIKFYSNNYKNIQSLVNLSIEDGIQKLSDEEKEKIKRYVDEITSKVDNRSFLGKCNFILGAIDYSEGNYELSIDKYNKASEYFEKVNNKMKLKSYYYISKCYEYDGQYESADIAFDKLRKEANRKDEL